MRSRSVKQGAGLETLVRDLLKKVLFKLTFVSSYFVGFKSVDSGNVARSLPLKTAKQVI